jgi:tRNA nucleotidyltransferase (CCA-adding enzyme)
MYFKNDIEFAKYIQELGGVLYIVGGFVRDSFLNKKSNDKDYVITGIKFKDVPFEKVVGASFPVYIVNINNENCEVALARKEFKHEIGHNGFSFYTNKVTIEEDLFRRDLTINAMAINILTKEIIDPYNGRNDIENKILRNVSNYFKDDYLRILRVCRFASQLGFSISDNLFYLMFSMNNDEELNEISYERIWKETEKSLLAKYPDKFFIHLNELCLLKKFMPEIAALDVKDMHDDTSLKHTLKLLYYGNNTIEDKLSLLCHDFGKGVTNKDMHPKHHGHDKLGINEIEKFCNRLRIPTKLKRLAIKSSQFHMVIKRLYEMRIGKCFKLIDNLNKDFIHVSRISFIDSAFRDGGNLEDSFNDYKQRCIYYKHYLSTIVLITGKSLIESGYTGSGRQFGETLFNRRVSHFKKLING